MSAKRAKVSVRVRFEVFKRDGFTCRYCGRRSPEVVLELDHVVAVSRGGSNDPMNLVTSCYECNRGKSDKNLSEVITGEDPHDRAVELLERERQLQEYERVQSEITARRESNYLWLTDRWTFSETSKTAVRNMLKQYSVYDINNALEISLERTGGNGGFIPYAYGILRNWKEQGKCHESGI